MDMPRTVGLPNRPTAPSPAAAGPPPDETLALTIAPLTSLAKLADLTLVGKPLANLQPLTELPKLKKLRIARKKGSKNDKMIAALMEKGVKVDDVVS